MIHDRPVVIAYAIGTIYHYYYRLLLAVESIEFNQETVGYCICFNTLYNVNTRAATRIIDVSSSNYTTKQDRKSCIQFKAS